MQGLPLDYTQFIRGGTWDCLYSRFQAILPKPHPWLCCFSCFSLLVRKQALKYIHTCIHMHTHKHIHTHIHTHHIYVHTHAHRCMPIYTCVHIHTCAHIHIYTFIHTCTPLYTHKTHFHTDTGLIVLKQSNLLARSWRFESFIQTQTNKQPTFFSSLGDIWKT